jgi:hypothetical protein
MWKTLTLLTACIIGFSFADSTKVNIWRKVSTDQSNPGKIVPLDMSRGYAYSDPMYIYIVVNAIGIEEEMVIVFPNGGYWTSPEPNPFLQELQKEFDSLEDYLKSRESKEIKKK